jgi:hypothetical protein
MSNQMLPGAEWDRNVGSPAFPVSFLHEYAVGLLWDALHDNDAVAVKTIDGSISGNLKEGVDRVVIPDSMQPIGGCIPDLALLDKDSRPVRVIEVIVTSPPTSEKMAKLEQLQNRGVEVVQVPVRNEDELKALVPSTNDGLNAKWAYAWNATVFDQVGIINIPRQQQIRRTQSGADGKVQELIHALIQCQPETRRRLVKVLEELDSLESRYSLSPKNPKRITQSNGDDGT